MELKELKLEDLLNAPAEEHNFFVTDLDVQSNLTPDEIDSNQSISDILIDRMNNSADDFQPEIPNYLLVDSEIVGYEDKIMQDDIYRWVLSGLGIGSVKDFGCGRGDFGHAFLGSTWPNESKYIGIDTNPTIINVGRIKYPDLDLRNGNWLMEHEVTDYTVCIGSLDEIVPDEILLQFRKSIFHAIDTTNVKTIFVFDSNLNISFDFIREMLIDYPFELDCSRYHGIYKLTVYCQKFE